VPVEGWRNAEKLSVGGNAGKPHFANLEMVLGKSDPALEQG